MSTPKPQDNLQAQLGELVQSAPDKLHPVLNYIVNNVRTVLLGVGAVVLVVALYSGWEIYGQWRDTQSANEFGVILNRTDDEAKLTALSDYAAAAPSEQKTQAWLATAELAMRLKNYEAAGKAFDQVAAATTDPLAKVAAGLGQAEVAIALNNPAKAKDILTGLKTSAPESYKASILFQLAMTNESLGEDQAALSAWEEFAAMGEQARTQFITDRIAMLKAKLGQPQTPAS